MRWVWIGIALLAAGCASTKVSEVQDLSAGEVLAPPQQVWVYDFAIIDEANPPDIPLDDEQTVVARQAAATLSEELVDKLREMDVPAVRVTRPTPVFDIILAVKGQFGTIEEGSGFRRMVIGFGAGGSEVRARVQIGWESPVKQRPLREFETVARSSRMPGLLTPAGIGAATGRLIGPLIGATAGAAGKRGDSVEGRTASTADEVASELEKIFAQRGWFSK